MDTAMKNISVTVCILVLGFLVALFAASPTVWGEEGLLKGDAARAIRVPVIYERITTSTIKPAALLTRLGFRQTDDMVVWALEVPGSREGIGVQFYIDADADRSTGRSKIGNDYYFDTQRKIITYYDENGRSSVAGNIAYLDFQGKILYIAIDRSVFYRRPLEEGFNVGSIVLSRYKDVEKLKPLKFSLKEPNNPVYFDPPFTLPFAEKRFGGRLLIDNKACLVWDAGLTKVSLDDRPQETAIGKRIEIAAARGEYEPFQLVLTPKSQLRRPYIKWSDLKGPGGVIKNENITLNRVGYVKIKVQGVERLLPDPLFPDLPEDCPENINLPLWFTVRIPEDTAAGPYTGNVEIIVEGEASVFIGLKVMVYNFTLPRIPQLKTAMGFDSYGAKLQSESLRKDYLDVYYRFFAEHRLGIRNIEPRPVLSLVNGEVKADLRDFDRAMSLCLDTLGMSCIQMPWGQIGSHGTFYGFLGIKDIESDNFKLAWQQYLRLILPHLKEKGWYDRVFFCIWDEPDAAGYRMMQKPIKWAKEVDPELKIMIFSYPPRDGQDISPVFSREEYKAVDIWNIVTCYYDSALAGQLADSGKRIWVYNAPGMGIGNSALENRLLPWWIWREGCIEGYLYWRSNFWRQNPWEFPAQDASFFYPNPADGSPVSSIRWEMLREGMEDYDYLCLLRQASKRPEVIFKHADEVEAANTLLHEVEKLIPQKPGYKLDPEYMLDNRAYSELRNRIAGKLELLLN